MTFGAQYLEITIGLGESIGCAGPWSLLRDPRCHIQRGGSVFIEPISSSGGLSGPVVLEHGDGLDEVAGLGGAAPELRRLRNTLSTWAKSHASNPEA